MTVAILISGSLFKDPQRKTSQSGRSYVTTTLKAAAADNASSDFWNVLAFGDTAGAELMRLGINERVTIQGGLKLELFEKNGETKISRTIFCDHVMALRQPPRERKPKAAKPAPSQEQSATTNPPDDLNDDLPF